MAKPKRHMIVWGRDYKNETPFDQKGGHRIGTCRSKVDRNGKQPIGKVSCPYRKKGNEGKKTEGKKQEPDFSKRVSGSPCASDRFLQKGVAQPKEKVIKGKQAGLKRMIPFQPADDACSGCH
ncbi:MULTISPECIES: hypothetical protein [Bacteroidales]|uniref:hypothetical protein n=1 Tax=Bacteroidales TaxID=171549 RepID=UPI001C393B77|nr:MULTISPECIES: hypothetical protein [Bacteroidales]MBV4225709.1 hypothetical protein [Parabacteroides distasonis]